jgi:cysteine desulfurase
MIYLDHAATTPMRPEAKHAMEPYLGDVFGNPSGVHTVSQRAKNALEDARERAAELIEATHPLEVVFTGGGTEADNLAVAGAALAAPGRGGIVTSAVEHEAVLEAARFCGRLGHPVVEVGVDRLGLVDAEEVVSSVSAGTAIVSVMAANNETGALEPIKKIAEHLRGAGWETPLHTDAIQAYVSEPVTVAGTGADMISLAAHKFGGPQGVGLLYVRDGIALEPVLHGGGQELGRRSGTHNVAGAVGMVAAMEAAAADREAFRRNVGAARDRFESAVLAALPDAEVNGPTEARLVQHSHLRFPGVEADTLLVMLDRAGIAAAAGSACNSGALQTSHVLEAMGMPAEVAAECVRFTFGRGDTAESGSIAAARVVDVVEGLR